MNSRRLRVRELLLQSRVPLLEILALLFGTLWALSLWSANPLGGFLHVPLALAIMAGWLRLNLRRPLSA